MTRQVVVYHAAALFNGRETFFNNELTRRLETEFGHRVILPQRDGLEFSRLHTALASRLTGHHAASAAGTIVYYLDLGRFLPQADIVVANLDEPLDEGVVTEICYAKLGGHPVIGFRTDSRSPFGQLDDQFAGMHFFPAYQCDRYVHHPMPCRDPTEADVVMQQLAATLDAAIREHASRIATEPARSAALSAVHRGAHILFDGIADIHSTAGLEEIVRRYAENIREIQRLGPAR